MERVGLRPAATFPDSERLRPYVSKLAIEWMRDDADLRHRQEDGTLVFVDISGFTSLTERLTKKGKVGSEEMNDLLDSTFTELLSVAYDRGAGVIKWGGDAVLLRFTGTGHAERACRAAWDMQRTMRSVGRLRSSVGRVTLRMSVGIHSGSYDFFFVGKLHRELVVAGPAADMLVEAETAAEAGEIVVTGATAAALPPALLGAPRGPGFLLTRPPAVEVDRTPPVGDVGDVDLRRCVPVAIASHLVQGGGEAEHRPLTIAFLHFGGVNELLASEGGNALADALEQCLDTVEGIALEHKVAFFDTDIAAGGGKIMLVSGAPTSSGNDEERMLRTLRAIMDSQLALPLEIGVNRGRIFAADFGPPYRRTYSFKGDAANLAARLMAKATPGQILTTDEVLSRSRTEFDVEPLEPFPVKGKSEPVQAFALGSAAGARTQEINAPLVGREKELQTLLEAVEAARSYEGKIVEIVGEPGIGKSRLIEELGVRVRPDTFISIQCDEYEATTPYHPFHVLLRSLLAPTENAHAEISAERLQRQVEHSAPHLNPWLPLIGVPLGLDIPDTPETAPLEGELRKHRLEEVVTDLLGMLLLRPTFIAFEDTHWMDDASAELLGMLLASIEPRPWLVVVARRDAPTGFVPVEETRLRMELEPLDGDDAEALVHAVTSELSLPPHEIAALAERAGGNPLFLTELLASRAAGILTELPDSVEGLMMAEIDRLAPTDRRVLRCAAVVGAAFTPELVAASLDEPIDADVWGRLAHYVDEGEGNEFRFRHALVRDAAYEGLPFRRRREFHERVGRVIEARADDQEDEASLLSLHFFHAHDFDRAWRYSRTAGQRAMAIYANAEAASFYERALEAARHVGLPKDDLAEVHEQLGDARLRLGQLDRAAASYRMSRRRVSGEVLAETRLLLKEAMVPLRLNRYPSTIRWLNRGLRLVQVVEGPEAAAEHARFAVWYATVRQRQRRPREAIEWCRRAIEAAERAGADGRSSLAHAYVILDWAYLALGRPDEAVYSPKALSIYEELGDLEWVGIVLNNMGGQAYMGGRWDETLELAGRARDAQETIGDRWRSSYTTFNIAEILTDQGRLEEARPLALAALRIWKAARTPVDVAYATSLLGRIAAHSGGFDEAHSLLCQARTLYSEAGEAEEALRTDASIVECLVLQGAAEAAIALLDDTSQHLAVTEGLAGVASMVPRLRGCALMQLGRLGEARDALEESLRVARQGESDYGMKSTDYEAALTLDALVRLGGLTGERRVAEWATERDAIIERLGIVSLPGIPLVAGSIPEAPTPINL